MPAVTVLSTPTLPTAFQAAEVDYGAIAADAHRLRRAPWSASSSRRSRRAARGTRPGRPRARDARRRVRRPRDRVDQGDDTAAARSRRPVIIDGPALFLQGAILLDGDPRRPHHGREVRRPGRRRVHPDGCGRPRARRTRRRRRAPGCATSEVFPLTLFAVVGMMLFPAAGDLLDDVRRARGALAAALHPLRAGPPSPAAVAGGLAEVLPARRLQLGVLPLRRRPALRLRRLALLRRHRQGDHRGHPATWRACCCPGCCSSSSACCSRSAPCRSTRGRPTSTRAPRRRSPASWPPAPRSPRSARSCASPTSASRPAAGTGARRRHRRRGPDHGRRLGPVGHPDRRQAAARLLLDRARRASSSSACWPSTARASAGVMFYLVAYGFTTIAAFAIVSMVRQGGVRGLAPVAVGRARHATTRSSPASSPSSCSPSPASR